MKKRIWQISIPVAVVLLLAIWTCGRFRISGRYSIRSHGTEQFAGSSLTHLALNADGAGQMWQSEGGSRDFRVDISWVSTPDGIDISIPKYKHWSYSYFSSPGIHHFERRGSRLTAIGKQEGSQLQSYGLKHGLPEKQFVFKKDVLQI